MALPSAIFVSSGEFPATEVIKEVFDSDLPERKVVDENITAYTWHIDNKYYSCDINLCALNSKAISSGNFAESVEAIIISFNSDSSSGLDVAESWLPFLDVYDADIKILVCRNCHSEEGNGFIGVSKRKANEWCIGKGFELVELEPSTEDEDPEDDFPETTGVKRIRQALHAYQWPNLVLKSEDRLNRLHLAEVERENDESNPDLTGSLEESLGELLENSDDFGDLFQQLSEMKARVATLSGDERKEAAEQVVKAFWAAMGGDEDELDD